MAEFRREDSGEIVEVDYETTIRMDAAGYVTLPDGVRAKRVNRRKTDRESETRSELNRQTPPSDNLGCPAYQVEEFRAGAESAGFTGVEFVPDPSCDGVFYQAKFSSMAERERYMKFRGFFDKGKSSGAALTPGDFERGRELIGRIF